MSPSILCVSLAYYSANSYSLTPPDAGGIFFLCCQARSELVANGTAEVI